MNIGLGIVVSCITILLGILAFIVRNKKQMFRFFSD